MRNDIEWICGNEVAEEQICAMELALACKFPPDFRNFIKTNSGASPIPHTFNFGEHYEAVFKIIYHFDTSHRLNILEMNKPGFGDAVKHLVRFADDPFGNYLSFDFRKDSVNPPILFTDHEVPLDEPNRDQFVANSFTELVDMLYES